MKITLKWKNVNTLPTTTEIFRSESPIDVAALPPAIASVAASQESFVDTVEYGKLYYYRLRNTNSRGSAISNNIPMWGLPYTGPGPQELIAGDMDCGYFGRVTQTELITPAGVLSQLPSPFNAYAPAIYTVWHKFIYKGKILYFPNGILMKSTLVSAITIYNAGLLYGTDDFGPVQVGAAPVNQRRIVKAGRHEFIVRQPRLTDSPDKTWDGVTPPTSGEWHDLILRMVDYVAPFRVGDGFAAVQVDANYEDPVSGLNFYNRGVLFQESAGAGLLAGIAYDNGAGAPAIAQFVAKTHNTQFWFRPVLELVGDPIVTF